MKKGIMLLAILTFCLISCKNQSSNEEQTTVKFELTRQWSTDPVFKTPESVFYDRANDVLYISNVNENPSQKDENGFISRMAPNGENIEVKWIEGLSSPKGMAMIGNLLYVTDVDELVEINVDDGKITKRWPFEGSKMLNDIASDTDGSLYISDSNGNSLFKFKDGKYEKVMTDGLNAPNGLIFTGDTLLLASMGSEDLAAINTSTMEKEVLTKNINKGDGIALTGREGRFLVSDWLGEVYMINPDLTKTSLLDTKDEEINAADITFIPETDILYVPTFSKNTVVAYKLEERIGKQ